MVAPIASAGAEPSNLGPVAGVRVYHGPGGLKWWTILDLNQ